ncbi:unnamed protein product [Miscanthus lutarioriparius]|uniref:Chromo domain-containing protein n=1 Tax=Miscanthus lutarioriparius TaxID=422564 RepID=A0A811R7V5_9POAL|nr:unnamed protein product [Miscanthus lutarioriparius]
MDLNLKLVLEDLNHRFDDPDQKWEKHFSNLERAHAAREQADLRVAARKSSTAALESNSTELAKADVTTCLANLEAGYIGQSNDVHMRLSALESIRVDMFAETADRVTMLETAATDLGSWRPDPGGRGGRPGGCAATSLRKMEQRPQVPPGNSVGGGDLWDSDEFLESPPASREDEHASDQVFLALSKAATGGSPAVPTVQFEGSICDQPVLILVNSGSSASFISTKIANKLSGVQLKSVPGSVQVAGGGVLHSTGTLQQVPWVLDLQAYDIIVGMDWLSSYSPTLGTEMDWVSFSRSVHGLTRDDFSAPSHCVSSGSYNDILVVVDKYSKYAHFVPLRHPFSASGVAKAFMDNIYKLHGLPSAIISDRDRIFTSTLLFLLRLMCYLNWPVGWMNVPAEIVQRRWTAGAHPVQEVLVRWSQMPPSLATWENLEELRRCFPRAPSWGHAGSEEGGDVSSPSPALLPSTTEEAARAVEPRRAPARGGTSFGPRQDVEPRRAPSQEAQFLFLRPSVV